MAARAAVIIVGLQVDAAAPAHRIAMAGASHAFLAGKAGFVATPAILRVACRIRALPAATRAAGARAVAATTVMRIASCIGALSVAVNHRTRAVA